MNNKVGVLHLVDSLASGGAEHVAIALANHLPQEKYQAYVCASRQNGPLRGQIQPHVPFYDLQRKGRFDLPAILRILEFTRREHIRIVHAHTTSLFLGTILCLLNSRLRLVWHDHFGRQEMETRPVYPYRLFARRVHAVFTVTRKLSDWSIQALGLSPQQVFFLPNLVEPSSENHASLALPGDPGQRIVCVANIRREKDHFTLLQAFARVLEAAPGAHLILVGAETDPILSAKAHMESCRLALESHVTWLGSRQDIPLILSNCDIGVLSSLSEGFPVVLLEYGRAGLAVTATQVGECAEILEEGRAGLLVPPGQSDQLAAALVKLLNSPSLRARLGKQLALRVSIEYCPEAILKRVCQVYEHIL